jgi:hypothetical protein
MAGEETTIWSDKTTKKKLGQIAEVMERSMAGQVRFMVDREYEVLAGRGLISEEQVEQVREEE